MAIRPRAQTYTAQEQHYSGCVAAGLWVASALLLLWLGLWSTIAPSPI